MIRHRWTGPNGAVVELNRQSGSPVWIRSGGVVGMGNPETEDFLRDAQALDGQELLGWKAKPRDCMWPVVIDGGPDWFQVQRDFWRSLMPGQYGVWRVTAPDNTWRELTCRFVPSGEERYDYDPSLIANDVQVIDLVADDPWWRGPAITRTFTPQQQAPFFAPPGSSAVLNLMSAFSVEQAQVTNPGDVEAWPVWTIRGPVTGFSVGVGAAVVASNITVANGRFLTIDSDPQLQTVQWDDGTLVPFAALTSVGFAPIPAGQRVGLAVRVEGTGNVGLTVLPRYLRAI